jgi:hypothetical protein
MRTTEEAWAKQRGFDLQYDSINRAHRGPAAATYFISSIAIAAGSDWIVLSREGS